MITLLGLLLTACGGATPEIPSITPTTGSSEDITKSLPTKVSSQPPENQEIDPNQAIQVPVPNVDVAPNPTETLLIKTDLEATDPVTVALATGKPHLVEFFAFW